MTCPTHPKYGDHVESCSDCRTVREIQAEMACHNDYAELAWLRKIRQSPDRDRKRLHGWLADNHGRLLQELRGAHGVKA